MATMVSTAGALGLTYLAGLGLAGLGRAAGARNLPLAWVVGWTVVWWPVMVVSTVAGPRSGAAVGAGLLLAGAVAWPFRTPERSRWWELAAGGAAVVVGAPLYLAPPYFFDSLVYHLGLPWSWLVNGTMEPMPNNLFEFFPLAGSAVYMVPLWVGAPRVAAGLHWLTFVVSLGAALQLARRLGAGGRAAWLAPACLLGTWHAVWVAGVAAADHLVALGVLVAAGLLLAPSEDDTGSAWTLPAAGLALGLALAAKYQGALPAMAVLGAMVLVRPRRLRGAAVAGGTAVLVASFWYVRNLVLTGNPVFPLLWSVFGGAGWTAREDARFRALVHEGVHGPWSAPEGLRGLVLDGPGLGSWLLVAVVLACVAVVGRWSRAEVRRLGVALLLMLAAWLLTSHTTRYAIPMVGLVGSLAAVGLDRLGRWPRRVSAAAMVALLALGGLVLLRFTVGTLDLEALWSGRVGAEAWRHGVTVNDPMPAYREVTRFLPRGARLLVVGEGRPYGCPGPHQVSSPYDTQLVQRVVERSRDSRAVAAELGEMGFGVMVVNRGEAARLREGFGVLRWEREEDRLRWAGFLGRFTTPLWREGGLEIRRLEDAEGEHGGGGPR